MYEIITAIVLILFIALILVLFYQKKAIVPKLMIIFLVAHLAALVFSMIMLQQIPLYQQMDNSNSIRDLIRSALTAAIFIPYFLRSERVMNTFIR